MERLKIWLLTTAGCALVAFGASLLLLGSSVVTYAQDAGEERAYVGISECRSCHRDMVRQHGDTNHGRALQEVERDKDPILGDFEQGADVRSVQFPGEDTARPFTADDITLAIGTGRYTQSYVYEVERNMYQVLPARWNTVTGQWERIDLAAAWPDPAYDFVQRCAGCHTVGLDVQRGRWEDEGVQCEACHGPGSLHAELADDAGRNPEPDELRELRAAINDGTDPQICGACHSQGATPEGQPAFPADYLPGATLTNENYRLYSPEDAIHWYPTGHARLPNMQFNEWLTPGHASALTDMRDGADSAADSCLACHSQDYRYTADLIARVEAGEREGELPAPVTMETARFGVTCTTCHNPHSETGLPFNLVDENYPLCVSCHSDTSFEGEGLHHPVQEMFEGAVLIEGIPGLPSDHFTNEDGPRCATCHMARVPVEGATRASHVLMPVMPGLALDVAGLTDTCAACHEDQAEPALMQQLIDDIQADTRERVDLARAAITPAAPPWVTLALDFVEGDGSLGIHNYRYTDELLDEVEAELGLDGSTTATASR